MERRTGQRKLFSRRQPYLWLAALALLAAHLALAYGFAKNNAMTFDEPIHVHGGLRILHEADFSVNPESGALSQLWLALPVNYTPTLKALDVLACRNCASPPELAADATLLRARMMTALLSCALGAGIFLLALRFLSGAAALLALALYSTHPLTVSNGALATSDVAGAAGFFFALIMSWQALRRISAWRVLAAGLALGLLFLAKMSAALILPTLALFVAVRTFSRYPLSIRLPGGRTEVVLAKWRKAAAMGASLALALLVAWALIWAAHGFRYRMAPGTETADNIAEVTKFDGRIPPLVRLAAKLKILPEAYLYGFAYTARHSANRTSFFQGEISDQGHPSFFPYLFLVKNPLGLLALFLVGAVALPSRRRSLWTLPLLLFSALFLWFALRSSLNIGFRHLLPVFPLVFLVCAAGFDRLLQARGLPWRALAIVLGAEAILASLAAHPNQLAYFNRLDGGPEQAYRHVVDSSLDWGQDAANLGKAIAARGIDPATTPVHLAYFGVAPLPRSDGFAPRLLPCFPHDTRGRTATMEPGYYCVSATLLQDACERPQASPDDARRFELLRRLLLQREPDFSAGHSILVYKLTAEDLAGLVMNR